jgi:hypothetical protein
LPIGATIAWYTNSTHTGPVYATPNTAVAGVYYAFYVGSGSCYSPASAMLTASVNACCLAGNTAPFTH